MSSHPPTTTIHLLLLLLTLVGATTAQKKPSCAPGSFRSPTGGCKPCPRGTYQWLFDETKCTPCPANTYNAYKGVPDESLCLPCPLYTQSAPGATSCTRCPNGGVRACGTCKRCPTGSFLSRCECHRCPAGKVNDVANARACTRCEKGYGANAARTKCVKKACRPGYEFIGSRCRACRIGFFRKAGMPGCKKCPGNTSQADMNAERTACQKCPAGTRAVPSYSISHGTRCVKCAAGTYTYGEGKAICRRKGSKNCPKDSFEDLDGDCNACPQNFRLVPRTKTCVPCARGLVSLGGDWTQCYPCKQGQFIRGGSCVCPPGTQLVGNACEKCAPGSYNPRADRFGSCLPCDRFSAAGVAGATECKKCPEGSSSDTTGGKTCVQMEKCGPGFVRSETASYFPPSTCISVLTGCPRGLRLSRWIRRSMCMDDDGKIVCPDDHVFDGVDRCLRCWAGSRVVRNKEAGRLQCYQCEGGSVGKGGLSRKCSVCPKGLTAFTDRCVNTYPPGVEPPS